MIIEVQVSLFSSARINMLNLKSGDVLRFVEDPSHVDIPVIYPQEGMQQTSRT